MNGMFVNKVAGAVLASALGFILINQFAGVVMKADVTAPKDFAYNIAVEKTAGPTVAIDIPFPSPTWLGARDAAKGAKVFKKCQSCHISDASAKDGTGPHLWNVVGRPKGSIAGFAYSEGMKAKGGVWDYESLDTFLTKPKDFVPKTKMAFNGLKKETDRAALIEYLRLASDAPIAQLVAAPPEAPKMDAPMTDLAKTTVDDGKEMAGKAVDTAQDIIDEVDKKVNEHAPKDGGH